MSKTVVCALALLVSVAVAAENIRMKAKGRDMVEYRDIEILSGDQLGLSVKYSSKAKLNWLGEEIKVDKSGGVVGLGFAKMTSDDLAKYAKKYGYDPETAKAEAKRRAQGRSERAKRLAQQAAMRKQALHVRLQLIKVEDDGAFCEVGPDIELPEPPASMDEGNYKGPKHYAKAQAGYQSKLKSASALIDRFQTANPTLKKPIYVVGLGANDNHVEGETWRGDIYPCGVTKMQITITYFSHYFGISKDYRSEMTRRFATSLPVAKRMAKSRQIPGGDDDDES